MKKTLLILLTLSLILSFFSCTTLPDTTPVSKEIEETVESKYPEESLFDFILTSVGKVMYKVHPEEGALIPACPDPLCKHNDSSCPMFKITSVSTDGSSMYYLRYDDDRGMFKNKICSYDFSTEEYKTYYKLGNTGESIQYLLKAGDYLFFNIYNPMATVDNSAIKLMRYNIESGEVIVLAENLPDTVYPIAAESGRIFWQCGSGDYYFTDYDYKNSENADETDIWYNPGYITSGYSFSMKVTGRIIKNGDSGSAFPEYCIMRKNLGTKEESIFIESTGVPAIPYKGKVIYTPTGEAKLIGKLKSGNGNINKYNRYGSKLYICNADGSDNRLLCDIPGNDWEFAPVIGGTRGCCGKGEYIIRKIISYQPMKSNPEYVEQGQDKVLVVNIVTGEYKILSAE